MARINLKRATVLLVTGRTEPVDLIGKTWQMRSPRLTLEIPERIRLRTGDSDRSKNRLRVAMHPFVAFAEQFWKEHKKPLLI